MRIRCSQISPVIGAVADNVASIERELADAVADGVDLVVLPELATSGYALTPAEARTAAWQADHPVFTRWRQILADTGTSAVVGFCEDGGGVLFNSAVMIVPGVAPTIYRKLHLWDTEKLIFTPGDERPPVVETPIGNLAAVICYDLEFPELPRSLALAGADIIAVPTNWPVRERPEGEHPHEVIHAMAAAQASGVVIATCDRAGDERGTTWTQGSTVVGADGWPRGRVDARSRLDAVVELAHDRHQISPRNHLIEDRRPDLY